MHKSKHCSYHHGISKNQAWLRFGAAMREVVATVQPPPKVKSLTNFFHRNQFFEWTQFSHVGRRRVEVWFGFERNWIFSFKRSTEEREESHRKRSREWRHKSFWRMKHRFPADMDVDIPIMHGAAPRREWQVASVFHCKQLNRHRIVWACHQSIATASDFKEGDSGKTSGRKNVWPSSLSDLFEKTPRTKMAQPWNFAGTFFGHFFAALAEKRFFAGNKETFPLQKLLSIFSVIFQHGTLLVETLVIF